MSVFALYAIFMAHVHVCIVTLVPKNWRCLLQFDSGIFGFIWFEDIKACHKILENQ